MWSSIDPAKKVEVGADGSYSLQVAGHSGSFTITAEYTATDGNYKTSTAKTVGTTGTAIDGQDIPLNYGHTTTVTVGVVLQTAGGGGAVSNGVTVVITAENGHEVGRGITSGAAKRAVITVDHPGRMIITASRTGYTSDSSPRVTTANTTSIIMSLNPASP